VHTGGTGLGAMVADASRRDGCSIGEFHLQVHAHTRAAGDLGGKPPDRKERAEGKVADGWATMAPEPHMEAVRESEADWVSAVNSAHEERTLFFFQRIFKYTGVK
jgi:hypothetical protein